MEKSQLTVLRSADGASASIARNGAQLISWLPANQSEQLFLSKTASSEPGQAMRGGVPVIFPQFAAMGPLPKHGFARNQLWQQNGSGRADRATFTLHDNPETRRLWPHAFLAELTVGIGGNTLDMELVIRNHGIAPFQFTVALHSYFQVEAISELRIVGLQNCLYRDTISGANGLVDVEPALAINGHIDRIYQHAAARIELQQKRQRLVVQRTGFTDTVVWNPWSELGATLADLEPDGYQRMVCVEAAAVINPLVVLPGAEWRGTQRLSSYPLG